LNNIFDQLYEVPDEDDHLEPDFNIDPMWNYELDLEYMQGEMI
jgi:hypothetical protein